MWVLGLARNRDTDQAPEPSVPQVVLVITVIVIPADMDQPLRQEQIDPGDLNAYRRLVGGSIEAVRLDEPAASLYLNDEGKLEQLPVNHRATALVWAHNKLYRGQDVIVGDTFLTGPLNKRGDDTTAPDEFIELLVTAKRFRVITKTYGDEKYYSNLRTFEAWFDAYVYGVDLAQRWTQVEDIRIERADG